MRSPAERQKKQRDAVSKALQRQKVVIARSLFGEGRPPAFRVLVNGRYYDVSQAGLDGLRDGGMSPADLGLEPVLDDNAELNP